MKKRFIQATLGIFILSLLVAFPSPLDAGIYNASSGITAIMAAEGGEMYIRWTGLQNPGFQCLGNNNGWAVIPANASPELKALARSLYFDRRPVRVDTSGCFGPYEQVVAIYTPGG